MHKFACVLLLLAACAVASGWAAPGADGVAAEQPSQEEIEARDDEASDCPISGEHFVAVHQVGATEQLNPRLVGLSTMATTYVPVGYTLDAVVSATRSVDRGVRFTLLVNVITDTQEPLVCLIEVLEQPWFKMALGLNRRTLTYTNCTALQAKADAIESQLPAGIINPVFVNSGQLDADALKHVDTQIVSSVSGIRNVNKADRVEPNASTEQTDDTTEPLKPLSAASKDILDDFFNVVDSQRARVQENFQSILANNDQAAPTNPQSAIVPITEPTVAPDSDTQTDENNVAVFRNGDSKVKQSPASFINPVIVDKGQMDEDAMKQMESQIVHRANDVPNVNKVAINEQSIARDTDAQTDEDSKPSETLVQVPIQHEASSLLTSPQIEGLALPNTGTAHSASPLDPSTSTDTPSPRSKRQSIPSEADYIRTIARRALRQLDTVDADDNKRILLDVLRSYRDDSAKTSTNYVLTLRVANSHCIEDMMGGDGGDEHHALDNVVMDEESCAANLVHGTMKICNIEVRVQRSELTVSKSLCGPKSRSRRDRLVGGHTPLDTEEAKSLLEGVLVELALQADGDTLTLKSVESSTKQLVAGMKYVIRGNFDSAANGADQVCTVNIWRRSWLGKDVVSIECDNERKFNFEINKPVDDKNKRGKRSLLYDTRNAYNGFVGPVRRTIEAALELEHQFTAFATKYNRQFDDELERDYRRRIFAANLERIAELNRREQGTATYGVTQFADMTQAEFDQYKGLKERGESNELRNPMAVIPNKVLPKSFDWRDQKVISKVKDQGQCGSCWAFSVIGNIEGLHAIKTGQLEEFSEQELVDCDTTDSGCNGGLFDTAYKAIEQLGGLESEDDYPYTAQTQQCQFNKTKVHIRLTGAVDLPADETAMAQYLYANGPLSIGLNANGMQFYRGGVSHPWKTLCSKKKIDHGVLIVGYGVSEYPLFNKTMPYWIVKNSWGPAWGEQGYYRVFRGDNTCGLATMVSSAVLE